jgi:hypothetical protein
MLFPQVWELTGLEPLGGMLCLTCIQHRLGRPLRGKDFAPAQTLTQFHDFGPGRMYRLRWLR